MTKRQLTDDADALAVEIASETKRLKFIEARNAKLAALAHRLLMKVSDDGSIARGEFLMRTDKLYKPDDGPFADYTDRHLEIFYAEADRRGILYPGAKRRKRR